MQNTIAGDRLPRVTIGLSAYSEESGASGPIQSIKAMTLGLKDEFSFKIIARRLGRAPVVRVKARNYSDGYADVEVRHFHPLIGRAIWDFWRADRSDVIMLNSFFDPYMTTPTLLIKRLGNLRRRPIIISPRGEFSPGALAIKRMRKQAFLSLAKRLGLYKDVWFHATSLQEAEDIRRQNIQSKGVLIAHDTSMMFDRPEDYVSEPGAPLRIVFVSRIVPIKNLEFALRVLARLDVQASFDIFGPIADQATWRACERLISTLPAHIHARYRGVLPHSEVCRTVSRYDVFFLPSRGENFGHVIHESLLSGTPALISDRTPWIGLDEKCAGWTLPLLDEEAFADALRGHAARDGIERLKWRNNARKFAEDRFRTQASLDETRRMLEVALFSA